MGDKKSHDQYTEEETAARAEAALKRMLATPHKPHSEMKLGKSKVKAGEKTSLPKKTRVASKGRVHKGKTCV